MCIYRFKCIGRFYADENLFVICYGLMKVRISKYVRFSIIFLWKKITMIFLPIYQKYKFKQRVSQPKPKRIHEI